MKRHVVLVGLPGAGKTTVGTLVASRLGVAFVDLDEEIERRSGMTVRAIFDAHGEARFRELEREAMRAVLDGAPAVVATGGGWAAQPGNLEDAQPGAVVLYLNTGLKTAVARTGRGGDRPLLDGDSTREMEQLYRVREPFYRRAHAIVETDAKPAAAVADEVVALARSLGGW